MPIVTVPGVGSLVRANFLAWHLMLRPRRQQIGCAEVSLWRDIVGCIVSRQCGDSRWELTVVKSNWKVHFESTEIPISVVVLDQCTKPPTFCREL
jgi:hypothetical protein